MLKILYAASSNVNSKIQLARFMQAMNGLGYIIKIAAYKNFSPTNLSIDWTLDCLQNIFKPETITLDNDNFVTYFEQVKYFNPDLIISDMEYYSSEIATSLGITLWQCSSSLLNFALPNEYKYNLGLFKKYAFLFNRVPVNTQRLIGIQDVANCNYVYSHFGDCIDSPSLKTGYEWIRPYHQVGKESIPCQHNMVGAMLGSDKKLLSILNKYPDTVCFTDIAGETYSNTIIKDIDNTEEYYCNIANCNLFMCGGQTSFLADAFYNKKYTITIGSTDAECIISSAVSEKLKLSHTIFDSYINVTPEVTPTLSADIKYLHERILEL